MTTPEKKDYHIDPTDDDFGALCNCAVRYCFGRRSYMPKVILDYITPLLPKLNDRTVECFKSATTTSANEAVLILVTALTTKRGQCFIWPYAMK